VPPPPPTASPDNVCLEILLPDPCLVVLCGPSGAGKSTFAREHFRPTQIVSSDRCRALISDTEDFGPESSGRAFSLLFETIRHRLALRRMTVADTTALERASRAQFIELARERRVPAILIALNIDESECLRREERRPRRVGNRVIRRQHRLMQTTLRSVASEGFFAIYVLDTERMDHVRIRLDSEPPHAPARETRPDDFMPRPFEGWNDPWSCIRESEDAGAPIAPAAENLPGVDAVLRRLGPVDLERRHATLEALTSATVDPRWMLFRPVLPEQAPARWLLNDAAQVSAPRESGEVYETLCGHLRAEGFQRVCLEAWPDRAEPAALILAREPCHALQHFGIEGCGALYTGPGHALLSEPEQSRFLEAIVEDLNLSAWFARKKSPVMIAQALAVWKTGAALSESAPGHFHPAPGLSSDNAEPVISARPPRNPTRDQLRLWLTDLLVVPETADPAAPDFLWNLVETCDLAEAFEAPPRLIVDLRLESPEQTRAATHWLELWWNRHRWNVVLTRTTRGESNAAAREEFCDIGWFRPPMVLSPRSSRISSAARELWDCRQAALECYRSGDTRRLWRSWITAAWTLPPLPPAPEQPDLFGPG
jgi:predicted kinase